MTYGVMMKLLHGLEKKGHCVVMDNFFLFHSFFQRLVVKKNLCNRYG
jgi:hypothetical protein